MRYKVPSGIFIKPTTLKLLQRITPKFPYSLDLQKYLRPTKKTMDREFTYKVLGCVYEVYKILGPGLLESIYEEALMHELQLQGFDVKQQIHIPITYKGKQICPDMRLDLIVEDKLILELKSVTEYRKLFEKQLLTYLRLMDCELGYVINFNCEIIKDSIYPVVNTRYSGRHEK